MPLINIEEALTGTHKALLTTNHSRFFRGQFDKYTWGDIGSSYLPSEGVALL
jgi:hypothetical protein